VKVFDLLGKLVLPSFNGKVGEGNQSINVDMSQLSQGMYTVRLEIDGKTIVKKITRN
jgi:YbbR domain-containing protein